MGSAWNRKAIIQKCTGGFSARLSEIKVILIFFICKSGVSESFKEGASTNSDGISKVDSNKET